MQRVVRGKAYKFLLLLSSGKKEKELRKLINEYRSANYVDLRAVFQNDILF